MDTTQIDRLFSLVLDNFSLASRVAAYLAALVEGGYPPPSTLIVMESAQGRVEIPGSNCGFFTTPVIHQACIDVRRTLAFFNLRYGFKAAKIETHVSTRDDDNWNILGLGLRSLAPEELADLSIRLFGFPPDDFLQDMLIYTDKQLAHFTTTSHTPDFGSIECSSRLMTEAILIHVYDALGILRPRIQLREDS